MKFTWAKTGDRVFEGPPVHRGYLAGFSLGAQRWVKRALQIDSLDVLDSAEIHCLYAVLSLKQIDHNLLPLTRASWDDLTVLDFEIAAHPMIVDPDDPRETCRECNQHTQFRAHTESAAVPVDPTPAVEVAVGLPA